MLLFNKILILTDAVYWKLNSYLFTFLQSCLLKVKGIKYGHQIKFYGNPTFKRAHSASISIGDNCTFRSSSTSNLIGINRPCIITALGQDSKLIIGNNCGFSGTVIGCFTEIILGNNVRCGANTLITDADWHLDDPRSGKPRPVLIHNNVWLGVDVIVLKGVTIGENSVIGAGSVVTKDIPANVIAGGNPCKILKPLTK